MPRKPNITRLQDIRDLDGLVEALRYPEDAELRAKAAHALGEIGDLRSAESLLRSCLQDPDYYVQEAARAALSQMLGNEAITAIAAYVPPDEAWLIARPETHAEVTMPGEGELTGMDSSNHEPDKYNKGDEDEEDDYVEEEIDAEYLDDGEVQWKENDIPGLMAIIRTDHSRVKRIKAIQALSKIENTRAIDALASIAIWSEEARLRREARQALGEIYGDNLDEVLQNYRQSATENGFSEEEGDEGEDDEDEDLDDEAGEGDEDDELDDEEEDESLDDEEAEEAVVEAGNQEVDSQAVERHPTFQASPYQPTSPKKSPPVIQEEKPGLLAYLLLGFLFLAVVAGLIYFLVR